MPSTEWERQYDADIREIRQALEHNHLYPHTWPASTHPDGSEEGDPAPRKWNPRPEE